MNPRSSYQLQILEKVGAPLLAAAETHAAREGRAEAAIVAELLARSVQSGMSLAQVMGIGDSGTDAESVRLALAALSGSLIAAQYRQSGKIPTEADTQRLITALSAALTFADNFTPAAGNTARLAALDAGMPPTDDTQVMIQCLQALVPAVVTIGGYSFGRPEKKMVQDVTERLVRQAGLLASRLLPGANISDLKLAELSLLRAMVPLYCEAHRVETERVMALDESARQQAVQGGMLPLEPLWQDFDRHLAMLDILGQSLLKSVVAGSVHVGASGPVPVATVPQAPAIPSGLYNPMAFFKAPPAKTGDADNT